MLKSSGLHQKALEVQGCIWRVVSFFEWDAEDVPIDQVHILIAQYEKVVARNNAREYVNRVVRPKGYHGKDLEEHDQERVDGADGPANGPELVKVDETYANMAGVEEVSRLSVRYEEAEHAWIVPVVAFWLFDLDQGLAYESHQVEDGHAE